MNVEKAQKYHSHQAEAFSHTPVNMISAVTINYVEEAIKQADESAKEPPLYFMINGAHPMQFKNALEEEQNEQWIKRVRGISTNVFCKSHAELEDAVASLGGNPQ